MNGIFINGYTEEEAEEEEERQSSTYRGERQAAEYEGGQDRGGHTPS